VVALLYVTLQLGMVFCALLFGRLLVNFDIEKLIQVIQGAAVATIFLNVIALWRQEAIDLQRAEAPPERPRFRDAWGEFIQGGRASRLLFAVGLGTAAFSMQDILLEPFGGKVLGLSVSQTTLLTAMTAGGTLLAFALAARVLGRGGEPHRLASLGALVGVAAFAAVISAAVLDSAWLFRSGAVLIGFGGGLFSVSTLIAAMGLAEGEHSGLALGAWGAVQATAAGVAIAIGGALHDLVVDLAGHGLLGVAMTAPAAGYAVVYGLEILLLLATLPAILPLAWHSATRPASGKAKIGLDQMP
jgi:BCD family chlorophyll transporter-like MFS transporter